MGEQPPEGSAPAAVPAKLALLTVKSSLQGEVWIDSSLKGSTPWAGNLNPDQYKVEVSGTEGGKRFNKMKIVTLDPGKRRDLEFSFELVRVQPRGKPDDMRVLAVDQQPLDSKGWIELYEGWHLVEVEHVPTRKHYFPECEVKVGQRLCKFTVKPRQEGRTPR
jgi:hypothetical protein